MSTIADHVEWRYVAAGKVRHAHRSGVAHESVCGRWVFDPAWWLGTGSQAEYERCASLPMCKTCLLRLGVGVPDGR